MLTLTIPVERMPPQKPRRNPWLVWAVLLAVAAVVWLAGCRAELAACTDPYCESPQPETPRKAPRKPAKPSPAPRPGQPTPKPSAALAAHPGYFWGVSGMQVGTL